MVLQIKPIIWEDGEAKHSEEPPFEIAGFSLDQIVVAVAVSRLARTPGGMQVIRESAKGVFHTLHALAQASGANRLAAWANPILISAVFERMGLLHPRFNSHFHLSISLLAGVELTKDFVDMIAGALPWNLLDKPDPSDYPSSIVFSSPSPEVVSELRKAEKQTEK